MKDVRKKVARPAVVAEAKTSLDVEIRGELTGDTAVDFYWEDRVARWLGVPGRRVSALRRRALEEGRDWRVHAQRVVYTKTGLPRLREHLMALGALPTSDLTPAAKEPPVPAGPPAKTQARVVRVFPNRRLLLARPADAPKDKPADVLVCVRDNLNFMPGMVVTIVHDARGGRWQFG